MPRKSAFVTLLVVLLMTCLSIVPAAAQTGSGDFEVIRAAAAAYLGSTKAATMAATDLYNNLNDGDKTNDPFVVDVRAAADYAIGHIAGAINIPYKDIAKTENLAKLPKDKLVVTYCYTGHTGQIASTVLNLLGYNVTNLRFGIMGWSKNDALLGGGKRFGPDTDQRDYPTETKANALDKTYTLPTVTTGATGNMEIIRVAADKWLNSPKVPAIGSADALYQLLNDGDKSNDPLVIDVRSAEVYALGHVPGAGFIAYKDIAKPENLAKLPTNQVIEVYCFTGHTGMIAGTILGVLGYQATNMKYGMMAWTKDDKVLGTTRFVAASQPDYKVEASAAAQTTGTPAATTVAAATPAPTKAATAAATVAATATSAAPAALPKTGGGADYGLFMVAAAMAAAGLTGAGLALRRRSR